MELVLMLLLLVSLAGAQNSSPPVTQQTLQQVAGSLQMYVDVLPDMPKIYGYSMQDGSPNPVSLTIGMYQKTWVCFWS